MFIKIMLLKIQAKKKHKIATIRGTANTTSDLEHLLQSCIELEQQHGATIVWDRLHCV